MMFAWVKAGHLRLSTKRPAFAVTLGKGANEDEALFDLEERLRQRFLKLLELSTDPRKAFVTGIRMPLAESDCLLVSWHIHKKAGRI